MKMPERNSKLQLRPKNMPSREFGRNLSNKRPGLVEGQRVVMSGGPLAGLSGVLVRSSRIGRALVSVDLPRRSVLVEMDPDWIAQPEPVGAVRKR